MYYFSASCWPACFGGREGEKNKERSESNRIMYAVCEAWESFVVLCWMDMGCTIDLLHCDKSANGLVIYSYCECLLIWMGLHL